MSEHSLCDIQAILNNPWYCTRPPTQWIHMELGTICVNMYVNTVYCSVPMMFFVESCICIFFHALHLCNLFNMLNQFCYTLVAHIY